MSVRAVALAMCTVLACSQVMAQSTAASSVPVLGTSTLSTEANVALPDSLESSYSNNWRDEFTPLIDPLHTRPQSEDGPLRVTLPPDLMTFQSADLKGNARAASLDAIGADSLRTIAIPCATAADAADLNGSSQALKVLQPGLAGQLPLLTLPEAVQLALCHNPDVRGTWSAIAEQAAALGQAYSAFLPQVSASATRQRSQQSYSGTYYPNTTLLDTTQAVGVSWRLWDFGARRARMSVARLQLQASLASQNAAVLKALAALLQNYTDTQIAQAQWHAQQALMPIMRRSLDAAQRREENGAGSATDTLQAVTTLARANLELSRSQGDSEKAFAQLTYTLGLPPGASYQLEDLESPGDLKDQAQTNWLMRKALSDWMVEAEQHHPAILAAKAQWRAAQAQIIATQSDGLPTLDVSYNYYRDGRPNQGLSSIRSREKVLQVSLTVPLFDGFNSTYKVRNAQAVAEQKAIEYQNVQQQVLQDIVQSHADAQAAWRNLDAAHQLAIAAKEAAHSTQRLYENGASDILQLNQNLISLQQAQVEDSRALGEWSRARRKLWLIEAQAGM